MSDPTSPDSVQNKSKVMANVDPILVAVNSNYDVTVVPVMPLSFTVQGTSHSGQSEASHSIALSKLHLQGTRVRAETLNSLPDGNNAFVFPQHQEGGSIIEFDRACSHACSLTVMQVEKDDKETRECRLVVSTPRNQTVFTNG